MSNCRSVPIIYLYAKFIGIGMYKAPHLEMGSQFSAHLLPTHTYIQLYMSIGTYTYTETIELFLRCRTYLYIHLKVIEISQGLSAYYQVISKTSAKKDLYKIGGR